MLSLRTFLRWLAKPTTQELYAAACAELEAAHTAYRAAQDRKDKRGMHAAQLRARDAQRQRLVLERLSGWSLAQ